VKHPDGAHIPNPFSLFLVFSVDNVDDCLKVENDAGVSEASPHIVNIGRMVEEMENKIRNTLNEIYFGKTKDIVNGLRSVQPLANQQQQDALRQDLALALLRRQAKGETN
jgi:capping protein beta